MGTRHLICVVQGNRYRIAQYGQWDGYPEGQGVEILDFLKSPMVEQLKKNLDLCSWITKDEYNNLWKEFGVDPKDPHVDYETYKKFSSVYPQLSRDTGAKILNVVSFAVGKIKLRDSLDFANSDFCEWAYVVDFDKNTFEVYRGFNETPLKPTDRFYSEDQKEDDDGLYPVKLLSSFDLSDLPTEDEFLEICGTMDEEQKTFFQELMGE